MVASNQGYGDMGYCIDNGDWHLSHNLTISHREETRRVYSSGPPLPSLPSPFA